MRLRKDNRASAWADLQERLMTNMGTLVPDTTSLKDMLGINVEIEEFLKATEGTKSVDPSERLQHWLNSPLPIPVVEAVVEDSGDDGDDDSGLVQ